MTAFGSRMQRKVRPGIAIQFITPSGSWSGTAGSGFSSIPIDPLRTTAKPWLNELTVPWQTFSSDLTVGFQSGAQTEITGIKFYLEGNTVTVTQRTYFFYVDVNGVAKWQYGFHIKLNHSSMIATSSTGTAMLYAEAIASDGTTQNRIMGPYTFYPRNTGVSTSGVYDWQKTVAPSGADYTSIKAALDASVTANAKFPHITITQTGSYPIDACSVGRNLSYLNGSWCVIDAANGVTATMNCEASRGYVRSGYDGMCFRGSNLVLDITSVNQLYTEPTGLGAIWLDGCTITASSTRYGLVTNAGQYKTPPSTYWMRSANPNGSNIYATDAIATDLYEGIQYATLARGCAISKISGDVIQNNKCNHNITIDDLDASGLRNGLASMTVTYSGGATTATLEKTGANGSTGSIILRENGDAGTKNTFTLDNTAGSGHCDVSNVVNWINGIANWSATLLNNTRPATSLSKHVVDGDGSLNAPDPIYVGSPSGAGQDHGIDIKSGTVTLTTCFDVHADIYQNYAFDGARVKLTAKVTGTSGNAYTLAWTGSGFSGPNGNPSCTFQSGTNNHGAFVYVYFTGLPSVSSTLVIQGTTYTFVASGATGNQVNIAGTIAGTAANLITVLAGDANVTATYDDLNYCSNRSSRFVTATNVKSAQIIFIESGMRDFGIENWAGRLSPPETGNGPFSQIMLQTGGGTLNSHYVLRNSTLIGQHYFFRTDALGTNFDGYCTTSKCSFEYFAWSGAVDTDMKIDHVHVTQGTLPIPANTDANSSSGGSDATLFVDYTNNNFTPVLGGGLMLADGTYAGRYLPTGSENL